MELLKLPKLKLVQLQGITGKVLTIMDALPEMTGNTTAARTQYEAYQQAMTKEQTASDKKTLDQARDRVNSGFFTAVQAEQSFPHESGTAMSTLQAVTNVTDKYGFSLNRMPYDEQTTATDNLIAELEKINMEGLPELARWIPKLKASNDAFKAGADEYFQDVLAVSGQVSASALAPGLMAEIEKLFGLLYAHRQIAGNEALDQAYAELEMLIDQY